jgi:uncharacterized protein YecE (DUF72 family)
VIHLGTSGFYYEDWIGPVYPRDLPRIQWLPFIAELVDTIELNVTYYRVPSLKTVEGWVERTPDDFIFSVKAHRGLTHERVDPDYPSYVAALSPLIQSGKLACVLAQFPHSFHPNPATRQYLQDMRRGMGDLPVVVEFRDRDWISEETFRLLEDLGLGFCSVDEPQLRGLMPPVARLTGDLAYVRFHGRNAAKWWNHKHAWERYDYGYSEDELRGWLVKLNELNSLAETTLVYANNHPRGQSLEVVQTLRDLLAGA